MKTLRPFIVIALAFFALANTAAAKPSPAMKAILRERLVRKYDLRLGGMIKLDWGPTELNAARKKYSMEVYRVPNPLVAADYLGYTIYRFRTEPRYLILRWGGLIGAFDVFATPVR